MARRKKRIIVVGLGGFGWWASIALRREGHEVIAVDKNARLVDRAVDYVDLSVSGDATDREFLRTIGAESADAAIVSTGNDLAASILTILALKDLGVRDIYVKVSGVEAARAVEAFNVTETIFPEREAANRLAHRLETKTVLDYVPIAPGYAIQEIAVPDGWLGRSLSELKLPHRFGITVVAIHDLLEGSLSVVPDSERPLKESDVVLVAGKDEVVARLLRDGDENGPRE
ncbi:MAG: TrkA family potassium uptake protein [Gemmatimonadota bacterium]|jgi:trk system potassium uptake protein